MAIVKVQNSASVGTGGVGTLPVNSTAGNLLVACVNNGTAAIITPPTGWTLADGGVRNGLKVSIYYYQNNPGGLSSFTFTNAVDVIIIEYSGVATTSALDTSGNNTSLSSPITATTTGNIAAANELAVGAVGELASKAVTTTIADSFTNILNNGSASQATHLLASNQLNPTSGSTLSDTGSSSEMSLSAIITAIAVFKPASVVRRRNFPLWI